MNRFKKEKHLEETICIRFLYDKIFPMAASVGRGRVGPANVESGFLKDFNVIA